MKRLKLTALVFVTLLCAQLTMADQPPNPVIQKGGGIGGGGGDVRPLEMATPADVRSELNNMMGQSYYGKEFLYSSLKYYVFSLFLVVAQDHDWSATPEQGKESIKLLLKNDILYQAIKRIRFLPQMGPCYFNGEKKDASALQNGNICMSLTRIASKTTRGNLLQTLMVLVAHEVGHVIGLKDKEKEETFAKQIEESFYGVISYRSRMNYLNVPEKELDSLAQKISEKKTPKPDLCVEITQFANNVNLQLSHSFFGPAVQYPMTVAAQKAFHLTAYCGVKPNMQMVNFDNAKNVNEDLSTPVSLGEAKSLIRVIRNNLQQAQKAKDDVETKIRNL